MTDQVLSTTDLVARLRENPVGFIREGYNRGYNVSRWLEENSPTDQGDDLDAFERVLAELDIRTHSDPAAGYWASNAGEAFRPTEPIRRVLLAEFFARQWRNVSFGQRTVYLSDDGATGSARRPWSDVGGVRFSQQLAPAIPLSELIAVTTPIEGTLYRALYLTYNAENLRMFRVGESANIPIAELATSERSIQLHKYGRGLRASYEALRQMTVDMLALHIQWMAVQSEIDKVAAVIDVIVNGDGNANTGATNYNLTTLDSNATAGTLTPAGWLAFKFKFANPYMLTTALMQEAIALQLALLTFSANLPYVGYNVGGMVQGLDPINPVANMTRYGWTSDAPANKIVGFDARIAIERVTEVGSEISEMARNIENQTEVVTMTETEGYAVLDPNASKILTVNA
jgi:hypothetical protein